MEAAGSAARSRRTRAVPRASAREWDRPGVRAANGHRGTCCSPPPLRQSERRPRQETGATDGSEAALRRAPRRSRAGAATRAASRTRHRRSAGLQGPCGDASLPAGTVPRTAGKPPARRRRRRPRTRTAAALRRRCRLAQCQGSPAPRRAGGGAGRSGGRVERLFIGREAPRRPGTSSAVFPRCMCRLGRGDGALGPSGGGRRSRAEPV